MADTAMLYPLLALIGWTFVMWAWLYAPLQLALAWGYVGIRVVPSLIQAIRNPIFIRFLVFALASVVLFVLFLRTVYLIL